MGGGGAFASPPALPVAPRLAAKDGTTPHTYGISQFMDTIEKLLKTYLSPES